MRLKQVTIVTEYKVTKKIADASFVDWLTVFCMNITSYDVSVHYVIVIIFIISSYNLEMYHVKHFIWIFKI